MAWESAKKHLARLAREYGMLYLEDSWISDKGDSLNMEKFVCYYPNPEKDTLIDRLTARNSFYEAVIALHIRPRFVPPTDVVSIDPASLTSIRYLGTDGSFGMALRFLEIGCSCEEGAAKEAVRAWHEHMYAPKKAA